MYITSKKAENSKSYVYVVASRRDGKSVKQEIVAYLGLLDDDRIPYLKAAFLPKGKRPDLVEKKK